MLTLCNIVLVLAASQVLGCPDEGGWVESGDRCYLASLDNMGRSYAQEVRLYYILRNIMCNSKDLLVLLGQRWLYGGDHLSRGGGTSRLPVWVWAHLLDWSE